MYLFDEILNRNGKKRALIIFISSVQRKVQHRRPGHKFDISGIIGEVWKFGTRGTSTI